MRCIQGAPKWPNLAHSCWSSATEHWSTAPRGPLRCCGNSAPKFGRSNLWDDFVAIVEQARAGGDVRAMVFEAGERPDLAAAALRAARKVPDLGETPTILDAASPANHELRPVQRIRRLHRDAVRAGRALRSHPRARVEPERVCHRGALEIGALVVDRAAHEVSVDGRRVTLTAKEFALLGFLAANRGRVFSRETLLARVWGSRYEGGARTVDIHVRRLRAKLGDALPLETLRGAGYKLRAPSDLGKLR